MSAQIARDPDLIQVGMFRAILHIPEDKLDNMGMDEYIGWSILLREVGKFIHAPYVKKDGDTNTDD